MSEFEVRLRAWLKNQGFNCDVVFDEDFGYDWKDNVLHVGTLAYPTIGRWFEQFLCEYGLEWSGILDPVLALIHELGHYATNVLFCEEEIYTFQFIKRLGCDDRMDEQAAMSRPRCLDTGKSEMSLKPTCGQLILLTGILMRLRN